MLRLIEFIDGDLDIPRDLTALYVWPDSTGPQYGSLAAFEVRPRQTKQFGQWDWADAIKAATAHANQHSIPTVYVVRV